MYFKQKKQPVLKHVNLDRSKYSRIWPMYHNYHDKSHTEDCYSLYDAVPSNKVKPNKKIPKNYAQFFASFFSPFSAAKMAQILKFVIEPV